MQFSLSEPCAAKGHSHCDAVNTCNSVQQPTTALRTSGPTSGAIVKMILTGALAVSITLYITWPLKAAGLPHRDERLRFNSDGTFQISVFEDLHFGESKLISTVSNLVNVD